MAMFVWEIGGSCLTIEAENWEGAYRRVIGFRMGTGQTVAEATSWFSREDKLVGPVTGVCDAEPYSGEIPEDPWDVENPEG
jgi:hypothetical protein